MTQVSLKSRWTWLASCYNWKRPSSLPTFLHWGGNPSEAVHQWGWAPLLETRASCSMPLVCSGTHGTFSSLPSHPPVLVFPPCRPLSWQLMKGRSEAAAANLLQLLSVAVTKEKRCEKRQTLMFSHQRSNDWMNANVSLFILNSNRPHCQRQNVYAVANLMNHTKDQPYRSHTGETHSVLSKIDGTQVESKDPMNV